MSHITSVEAGIELGLLGRLHRSLVTVLTELSGPEGLPVPSEKEVGWVGRRGEDKKFLTIGGNQTRIPWPFSP